jgi:sirohydrochlorin ferrochelatase
MSHAILIAGHGSRDPDGIQEFLGLARAFRQHRPDLPVAIGFLEFARPTIQEGIDQLVVAGHERIVVLPGVLMAAGHAKNDLASEVRLARQRYPEIDVRMGAALDVDARLLRLCRLRYQEAVANLPPRDPSETLLLLVGRGSSDPDANSNVAKVARFLQEGYPTGWAGVAFSGVARPLVEEALPVCERAGFRRIVVQPYFLFTGILLKRVYQHVEERRRARPDLEMIAVPHLQADRLLIEAFADRAEQAVHGAGHMNCSLCQYRVPIIGYEHHVGEPQRPHHHHVQGLHEHVHQLEQEEGTNEPHSWSKKLLEQLHF